MGWAFLEFERDEEREGRKEDGGVMKKSTEGCETARGLRVTWWIDGGKALMYLTFYYIDKQAWKEGSWEISKKKYF